MLMLALSLILWLLLLLPVCTVFHINGSLGEEYEGSVADSTTHVYGYYMNSSSTKELVVRLRIVNIDPVPMHPILVVARQRDEVIAFSVPIVVNNIIVYRNVSRTLCPLVLEPGNTLFLVIELSSFSSLPVHYKLRADSLTGFDLRLDQSIHLTVHPAQPVYFRYRFSKESQSVAIKTTSTDNACMVLSAQRLQCPVYDGLDTTGNFGPHQTVTTLGTLSVNSQQYTDGFYVVLTLLATDFFCTGIENLTPIPPNRYDTDHHTDERFKVVTLTALPTPNRFDYVLPVSVTIAFFASFYLAAILIVCVHQRPFGTLSTSKLILVPSLQSTDMRSDERDTLLASEPALACYGSMTHVENDASCTTPISTSIRPPQSHKPTSGGSPDSLRYPSNLPFNREASSSNYSTMFLRPTTDQESSGVEVRGRTLPDEVVASFHSDDSIGSSHELQSSQFTYGTHVADLSRKRYTTLTRKYLLYFWYLIIISIFYALPTVQLIMIYQKALVESGNEDLCFYNFECARPFGIFTAFNNIISNVGYVMLGLLFLAAVAHRDLLHRRQRKLNPILTQTHGIPQHYGLFYSMGLALSMEGMMSACYHMCPSFSNFQFDTAYMYILAALIMLKIYQTRHPDVNASAHSAYMVMAVVILLGVTGVIYGSDAFWIAFTIFFLLMSVLLTAEIYYMGRWSFRICMPYQLYASMRSSGIRCLRPSHLERMILLLIANVVNFALAGYGIFVRPKDFSSFLLSIFMVNVLVYTLFYIFMKLLHHERIRYSSMLYLLAGLVSWSVAMVFFVRRLTTWEATPAQSRAHNEPCLLFNFYDSHDIWHFLSATSMFFSFMMLLNLDDDLADKPRNQIAVF